MNAIAQNIRFKFGGFWRQLLQKLAGLGTVTPTAPAPDLATPLATGNKPNGAGVALPLPAVLAAFPVELRSKILPGDTADLTLTVPYEKVASELARGEVKMAFGDIRRTAPQAFAPGLESDSAQVVLPLNEILARLDPALLARRPTQKKPWVLPEEIASPFAGRGEGLTVGVRDSKPAPAATESAKDSLLARKPVLQAVPALPIAFKLPAADDRPQVERRPAWLAPEAAPTWPLRPQPLPPSSSGPPQSEDYLAAPPVARAMQPAKPTNGAPASATAAVLIAPLTAFAAAWPEALRQEIVELNLVGARLAMPVELIESSLKHGRVTFPWTTLRSWIRPAAPPGNSVHDAAELELPLSVVAPLYLAYQNGAAKPPRVNVDETIPDVFFGSPKPEPAPTPKPADTSYYIWGDHSDTPRVEDANGRRRKPPGADVVARPATPNEIVSRAAALEGVAGALIALPEGMLVSGRIPPEFNGDTLAAFLPQIFSKVSQATKELRLGDLKNLNFTAGNVPWALFRVNALFFAAFGRADGSLPTSELARLATELDRRR